MRKRMAAELDARTRARWPDEPDKTHLDYCADWQANGQLLRTLATQLDCSPSMLSEYLRINFGAPRVRDVMSRAREEAAHQLAEQSIEVVDGASANEAGLASAQARSRQWLAQSWNREDYGTKGASVTINVGSLMLDALRQPLPNQATAILPAIAEDAHDVTIETATSSEPEQQLT
jgi:terminase small subunit-like protein